MKKILNLIWDTFLIVVCVSALTLTLSSNVRADYYVVTSDFDRKFYNHKRFVSFGDCRREFRRITGIINITGGRGHVVCVPQDVFDDLELN